MPCGATQDGRVMVERSERMVHWRREWQPNPVFLLVRRGGHEEIPLIQDKEQRLLFAGAAMKRYPTSKVRETQVRR